MASIGAVVAKLTLFGLLSALEADLREIARVHVTPQVSVDDLLDPQALEAAVGRYRRERGEEDPRDGEALLPFLEFADAWQVLNRHRKLLPEDLGTYLREITEQLESLVPVRNRVAHSRPLDFDDLPRTTVICAQLCDDRPSCWRELTDVRERLRSEPGFVLSLELPQHDTQEHNLPVPDFDDTGFVGRQPYVDQVMDLCRGPFPIVTIKGDGGAGKTALALRVAYAVLELPDRPFDAVVWSTSKSTQLTPTDIARIEGAISDSLGLIKSVASELGGANDGDPVDEVLAYMAEFRILVVLDNLETVLDDRIRDFVSRIPHGSKILITSRIGLGPYEHPVVLKPMSDDEAVLLIRELAKVRDVEQLVKMPNARLASYCARMHHSPGYIKWFVSAVQAGRRPEEILERSDMFLDFCMSNVYEYLGEPARRVLESMQCVPGRHSQARLAFLNEIDSAQLSEAIVDLLATNMVTMTSVPTGSSFESQYELADLPRAYLSRHHPPTKDTVRYFTRRRRELTVASEAIQAAQRANPYLARTLSMRSESNLVVARYLLDALAAIKDKDFDTAEHLVEEAGRLTPEWFEVRRVEASVRVAQGNYGAAQDAFEAALELEPEAAALRFWYAIFLVSHMEDNVAAIEQLEAGRALDPETAEFPIELARVYLFERRFDDARRELDVVLSRISNLHGWKVRKAYDLNVQYYQRYADWLLEQGRADEALGQLEALREAYESVPREALDEQLQGRLNYISPAIRQCIRAIADPDRKKVGSELATWVLTRPEVEALPTPSAEGRVTGRITRVASARGYGFVRTHEGRDFFVHATEAADRTVEFELQEGDVIELTPGRDVQGRARAKDWVCLRRSLRASAG